MASGDVAMRILAAVLVASSVAGSGIRQPAREGYLDALEGRWRTEAIHLYADGERLVEQGDVNCGWILERTYLRCDRRHRSQSAERLSQQLYVQNTASERVEMLTLAAGRAARVLLIAESSARPLVFVGTIPAASGSRSIRGTATVETRNRIVYRNEVEDRPNRWRTDYIETYIRR